MGSKDEQSSEHVCVVLQPTSGFVGTQPMLTPISGGFVGTQPMLEPIGGAFAGTQAMLVPMAAPAPLPPVLPTLRGSAAEVELLANVELAEQRLWEFQRHVRRAAPEAAQRGAGRAGYLQAGCGKPAKPPSWPVNTGRPMLIMPLGPPQCLLA